MCGTGDGRGSAGEEGEADFLWEEYGNDDADADDDGDADADGGDDDTDGGDSDVDGGDAGDGDADNVDGSNTYEILCSQVSYDTYLRVVEKTKRERTMPR